MRILVATDAWSPQVNGVVHSLQAVARALPAMGAAAEFLTPEGFRSFPMPTYPDIRLALAGCAAVARRIEAARPDHIHIATEGPIGLAARRHCLARGLGFTTSYHTRFPEYLSARMPAPERLTYALLRRFHNAGRGIMVSTQSMTDELAARGFKRIMRWSRGVDHALFRPRPVRLFSPRKPAFLYVGRIAVEKNIEAFLALDLPGLKVVVGDGPHRKRLERRYPDAVFTGMKTGADLAEIYSSCDVFVFPSRTDTFGIVLLEALASGLPVAAYPAPGPIDVIASGGAGVLSEDLRSACLAALEIPADKALALAETYSWEESARQFLDNVTRAKESDANAAGPAAEIPGTGGASA